MTSIVIATLIVYLILMLLVHMSLFGAGGTK